MTEAFDTIVIGSGCGGMSLKYALDKPIVNFYFGAKVPQNKRYA